VTTFNKMNDDEDEEYICKLCTIMRHSHFHTFRHQCFITYGMAVDCIFIGRKRGRMATCIKSIQVWFFSFNHACTLTKFTVYVCHIIHMVQVDGYESCTCTNT